MKQLVQLSCTFVASYDRDSAHWGGGGGVKLKAMGRGFSVPTRWYLDLSLGESSTTSL